MHCKVSIIVPVFNGEKYVKWCCEQLKKQTLKEIQIILINDGSNDESGKLIDECAYKFDNVIAIHQENHGVSAARNNGIKNAIGEYIGFVDVDDEIDYEMYERLYQIAIKNNLDTVCMEDIDSDTGDTVYKQKNDWMIDLFHQKIGMSACTKLFKRDLIQENLFPEGIRINEDLFFVYNSLALSERVGLLCENKYHYMQREGSSSKSAEFTEKYFDAIKVADWIYEDALEKFPELFVDIEARKAKTYLRISKIYYMRKYPKEFKKKIAVLKKYLISLDKNKLSMYFNKNDIIRYYLCLYAKPLFIHLIKTIDKR